MTDYKDTLNLPKTAFPMKANLAQREPLILQHWQDIDLYQQLRALGQTRPRFVLHDGPPYANGRPHLGTALNKTLKDMVIKSKTLSGYDAPYVPGWDCHGLPIELNVEKKQGKAREKLSPQAFRAACRAYAKQQVQLQSTDFQRLGVIGDWAHPYLTMDYQYEADTVRALAAILKNGHLLRGQKPVHWCTDCGSALAEAEVEYRDKASPSIYVRFDAVDAAAVLQRFTWQGDGLVSIPIWTTTPWTLPANEAVCVHPELYYALVECQLDQRTTYLVLAKELVDNVMQALAINEYAVHGKILGAQLEGLLLQHPFLAREVPIVLGQHVTLEAGTGNVHTAPAHGQEDYVVCQHYQLPVRNPVDARSCFIDGTPLVAGMHVFKANEPIMVALADRGKLLHQVMIQHSYPHCWRHKTPLIFRATPQWFISMEQCGLRQQALQAIASSTWIPAWGQLRIRKMVESRPDWCISRQRTWGIPITLLTHQQTGELHPEMPQLMEKVAQLIERDGIDAWYHCDLVDLIGAEAAQQYIKGTDILDVWFESGVTHHNVLQRRAELAFPADMYLEGSDQHRGWFQSSLLSSLAISGQAPFKTVLTHGYVVDGKGLKMSKSIGNVILPADVVKSMGADVLRLWAASTDHTNDINVSPEILNRAADAYRRIRNTARFLLSNLADFNPASDIVAVVDMVELDRWAVQITQDLQAKILTAYDQYQFQTIYQLIHNFCTVEMGSFYLDIIKDRQYTTRKMSTARRSAQTALYYIAEALVRWIAPILSFTAEEIWQHMPGKREPSVFLVEWFKDFPDLAAVDKDYWRWMMLVRTEVNKALEKARHQGQIGSGLDAEVILSGNAAMLARLQRLGEELRFVLITSAAQVSAIDGFNHAEISDVMTGLDIQVQASAQQKCLRCWQRRAEVGSDARHPQLCLRCVENIDGHGEIRQFA